MWAIAWRRDWRWKLESDQEAAVATWMREDLSVGSVRGATRAWTLD